jgi:hypothetical protein
MPVILRSVGRGRKMERSMPAWATQCVPGQSRIYSRILFQNKTKTNSSTQKKAIKKIKDKGRSIHILQDSSLPQSPQIEMNQWLPTELP